MRSMTRLALALVAALGWSVAGCGPAPPSNLSPTSDQDAHRHNEATRYTRELARRNQQAEREALGRISRTNRRGDRRRAR
jgi:hypothetical protein